MPRIRKNETHLPKRMRKKKNSYFHVETRGDGKQHWKSLGTNYARALQKWVKLESGDINQVYRVTDAIEHYITTEMQEKAAKTKVNYTHSCMRLSQVFGEMIISDLKPKRVFQYLREHRHRQIGR